MVRVLTVFGAADLDLIKPWARRFDSIQVKWRRQTEVQNSALQATIEREYLACGCRAGRIALIAVLIAVISIALISRQPINAWKSETWIAGISAIILVPMAAKLLSIVRARLRLFALIRELQRPAS